MPELKPCPFCGGYVHLDEAYSYFRDFVLYCEGCDMVFTLDSICATKVDLIEEWNQRAEPENRLLTLEELAGMANKGDWELAWMECRNIKSEKFFLTQKLPGIAGEHGVWFVTPGKADDIFYAANSYNKTWRCWPRKPTLEQMATEKWEE